MNSLKSRSFRLSLLLGGLAALGSIPGCGSDDPTVTCGAGTVEKNSTCIPSDVAGAGGAPDSGGGTSSVDGGEPPVMNGGGGSGGSGGEVDAPTLPSFEGVRAVAPASDSSLLVVWSPASYADTDPADFVYEVFVALLVRPAR
jgi:hypothetical protein